MKRLVFEPEHEQLRDTARQFIEKECVPHAEKWESERLVDRESYVAAGKYGLIGFNLPEKFGGGGDHFGFVAQRIGSMQVQGAPVAFANGVAELTPGIAIDAGRIPTAALPDPFDRLLVATARGLGVGLLTRDRRILDYAEQTGQLHVVDAAA